MQTRGVEDYIIKIWIKVLNSLTYKNPFLWLNSIFINYFMNTFDELMLIYLSILINPVGRYQTPVSESMAIFFNVPISLKG